MDRADDIGDTHSAQLRAAVLNQLDRLDEAAATGTPSRVLPVARTEMHRLAEGLRSLLDEHRPDEHGRCPTCPGTLRTRRWPCAVWLTAHRHLMDDHGAQAAHARLERAEPLPAATADRSESTPSFVAVHVTESTAGQLRPAEWSERLAPPSPQTPRWASISGQLDVAPPRWCSAAAHSLGHPRPDRR